MTPKGDQRGIKTIREQKTLKRGPKKNRDERTFRAEGGAKSEKHYNPRFIFVPPMGPESRTRSQDAVGARIGGRGGVSGGVGGEVQNKICTDLGQLSCTPGPSKRGAADSSGLRHSADPNGSRLESLKSKESKER